MTIALYPGSFDPLTNGHVDVARRASKLFDKVIIVVAENPEKKDSYMFSTDERVKMAQETFKDDDNISVIASDRLVVEDAKRLGAITLIRGLRAVSDYEYEYQLFQVNHFLDKDIDMIYFMAKAENAFISSSNIKELIRHKRDVSKLVPEVVYKLLKSKE